MICQCCVNRLSEIFGTSNINNTCNSTLLLFSLLFYYRLMTDLQPSSCPLRGCSELYRIPMVEYKVDSEGTPCEYKTPFRRNTTWHRVPTAAGPPLSRSSPTQGPDRLQCQQILQQHQAAIPRSTSFDRKLPDGSRYTLLLLSLLPYFSYSLLSIYIYIYIKFP